MPFANEHAARIHVPGSYKRLRRENDAGGEGVDFIWGVRDGDDGEVTEVQSIRFDAERFTPAEARDWLSEHDYDPIGFEEATGETEERVKARDRKRVAHRPPGVIAARAARPLLYEEHSPGDGEMDDPLTRWVQAMKVGAQYVNQYEEAYDLDDEGAAHVVEVFRDLTTRKEPAEFIADFNHYSTEGGPTLAHEGRAGTIRALEHRKGEGVWALVEFTGEAAELLRGGKFGLVSPEIWSRIRDPETGAWIDGPVLAALALVERPALHGMERIAARQRPPGEAKTLAARFGLDDLMAVMQAIDEAFRTAAKRGDFGEAEIMDFGDGDFMVLDPQIHRVDPDYEQIEVRSRSGIVHLADLSERTGPDGRGVAFANIVRGRLHFEADAEHEPDGDEPEEPEEPEEDEMPEGKKAGELTLDQAKARITGLETELAELRKLKAAAGDLTPEQVQTLRQKPAADAEVSSLRASVQTLASQLEERGTEILRMRSELDAAAAQRAEAAARAAVDSGERAGKVTPATREMYVQMALRDRKAFDSLLSAMPVVVHLRERGTASGAPDGEIDERDLHGRVMREAKRLAGDGADDKAVLARYADALAVIRREDPALVSYHSGTSPRDLMRVVE